MLDYLIAVSVALIGLAVVYTLFNSIESKDTDKPKVKKAQSPSPQKAKSPAAKKPTKKERQQQREEDEIIAKELAAATSGMHTDKRDAKIITLDEYRDAKKEKQEAREKVVGPVQTAFSPKQVEADREQGFSVVKRQAPKKEKSPVIDPVLAQKESLDKRLGQFFRSNAKKGKKRHDEDQVEGPKVIIKGDLTSGRSW